MTSSQTFRRNSGNSKMRGSTKINIYFLMVAALQFCRQFFGSKRKRDKAVVQCPRMLGGISIDWSEFVKRTISDRRQNCKIWRRQRKASVPPWIPETHKKALRLHHHDIKEFTTLHSNHAFAYHLRIIKDINTIIFAFSFFGYACSKQSRVSQP